MFEHKTLQNLNDYFLGLSRRRERGVYFYRINGYSKNVEKFLMQYYEAARLSGVMIEGKIPNPDENNLAYYEEIMGTDFQLSMGFITFSLKKWLPRLKERQREYVAGSIYDTLDCMRKDGKNENMLKNAYIKFMCWFYYKFERIVNMLGDEQIPKILYEGIISNYELKFFNILSAAGCDIVLLQHDGDSGYLKLDPASRLSECYSDDKLTEFPDGFKLDSLKREIEEKRDREMLYGAEPGISNCTNEWIKGKGLEDILQNVQSRGRQPDLFYNCFCRINGVWDKLTYMNELYQFQLELKGNKRRVVIIDNKLPVPSMEEINTIERRQYGNQEQMLKHLSGYIKYSANIQLQRLINKVFIDIMLEESKKEGMNLNRLTNKAVYLLCWLRRYSSELFNNWHQPEIACFIYFGGCKNENEAMFMRLLARLPVDVLILVPNLNVRCCLCDSLLYERNETESLEADHFPQENTQFHMATAAYHAERELDSIMYQDSGMYRNQQYKRAVSVTLRTMYEEIAILWDQEVKYRPNFSTVENTVNIPVIFAKVSGVKDGNVVRYWEKIQSLITGDSLVIRHAPFISGTDNNPLKPYAALFFKNGRLQRDKIKSHPCYQYGFLREEMQEHILDKLQLLIDQKIIKGTFENGTEYTIISVALNMNRDIIRVIQKFDFTKKNPKLIYINTTERVISLEDSIFTAFLNLIGFDVVFFAPTGYQSVEKYFNGHIMEEHQIGEYIYDLQTPDFKAAQSVAQRSWKNIFKR